MLLVRSASGLRTRVERPIQQIRCIDFVVGHPTDGTVQDGSVVIPRETH
jgi:hypothetical protein